MQEASFRLDWTIKKFSEENIGCDHWKFRKSAAKSTKKRNEKLDADQICRLPFRKKEVSNLFQHAIMMHSTKCSDLENKSVSFDLEDLSTIFLILCKIGRVN